MNQGASVTYCRYSDTKGVELVYQLTPQPLLFLDLGLVFPGHIIWEDRSGSSHPMHAGLEYYGQRRLAKDDIVGRGFRVPFGLAFEAQPARPGPEIPYLGSLIYEEGRYRMWYATREPQSAVSVAARTTSPRTGFDLTHLGNVLRYAESDDGLTWHTPALDYVTVEGAASNILFGSPFMPELGFAGHSVFRDPSAPPHERYKMTFMGRMAPEQQQIYGRRLGQTPDPLSLATANQVIYGAVSPDGFSWSLLPDPLMLFMSEESITCFDPLRQAYVMFIRYWHTHQRRAIGRAETRDFQRWPQPRPLLLPGLADPLTTDFYTNAHTFYPGHDDIHLLFVTDYYRGVNDQTDIRLAVSLDGEVFDFVPGGPVISRGPGDWAPEGGPPDAGCIFAGSTMVPFGDEQVGIIYRGYNVPHKWPRTVQWQAMQRWALWPRDRLVALIARAHGEFVTAGLVLTRPTIVLNVLTEMSGQILVELMDAQGVPVPGYGFAEADPIVGDHPSHVLTWNGASVPAEQVGQKIYLRMRMTHAKLFSVSAR